MLTAGGNVTYTLLVIRLYNLPFAQVFAFTIRRVGHFQSIYSVKAETASLCIGQLIQRNLLYLSLSKRI